MEHSVIVNTDLVTFTVAVTDPDGRAVQGLNQSDFTIFDNKVPQQIAFFSDADAPCGIGIVFDFSESMSGELIMQARELVSRFVETGHQQDEFFLLGFSSRPEMLLEWSRDSRAVLNRLTSIEPRGSTALYDAVHLGVEKVIRRARSKRVLLVISDGQDNNSHYSLSEVKRFLKESDAVVYAVGVIDKWGRYSKAAKRARSGLKQLAAVTGGRAFFPTTPAETSEAFERISLELRHQYSIGYKPSNLPGDGGWHRLRIRVTRPPGYSRLVVRTKEGYYAARAQQR